MRTMLLRLICITSLMAVCIGSLTAQSISSPDLIPPSPTAAALSKVADMPVNLFKGTPEITIPLYTVKERALISNIALRYTGASGIKIQDVAGPASLGWALDAGGIITRTVRGLPDEEATKGYCMNNNSGLSSDPSSTTFRTALQASIEVLDIEPDIFNCSVGGRIIFNSNKAPRFIHEQGYVIKKNGLFSADSTWEILDSKGDTYLFGKNITEREHSRSNQYTAYISSWYLTEIRSANGEVIRFTYEKQGVRISYVYYAKMKVSSVTDLNSNEEISWQETSVHIFDPVYLKEIITSNNKVSFAYNDRWDMIGQKAIEKITISDIAGNIHTAFRFNNGYFSDGEGNPYARPKLLGVEQLNKTQDSYIKVADFCYNEAETLPTRISAQFDHWGYYNNNPSGMRLKSEGATKTPNLARCKAGVLSAIYWPTGGQTHFDYELNTYRKNNISYEGGGLRIASVRQIEGGNTRQTNYSYVNIDNSSSGLLQAGFNPDSGYISSSTSSFVVERNGAIETINGETTIEYDLPLFQLLDLNGTSVGYSRVVITYPDQSKEIQVFQNYGTFPDKPIGVYVAHMFTFHDVTSGYTPNKYGFFNFYTKDYRQRGLLKEKQLLSSSGSLVQKTVYNYNSAVTPNVAPIAGIQKKPYFLYTSSGSESLLYVAVLYHEISNTPQLVNEEVTFYNEVAPTVTNKAFTRNEYKVAYPFLIDKQIKSLSNGDSTTHSYKYPMDILGQQQDIAADMYQRNIILPVETVIRNKSAGGELVTEASLNLYSWMANRVLPSSIKSLEITEPIDNYQGLGYLMSHDSRCQPKVTFDLYASSGELLQYHEADNVPVAIFWGYNHAFPVAKIVGATYADAVQYVDTAVLNAASLTETGMRTELQKLRQNLGQAFVTTLTYQPLIGIVSEKDPSGKTLYYEYDSFSRLKLVRDANENIVKQYTYYYSSAGGWQDTETKRCLKDINGKYTGEEEVQQIDKDVNSSTYNQTRWRLLGHTSSCNKPIYAKLSLEEIHIETRMSSVGLVQVTAAHVVVDFFEDAACTIPQYVRRISVNYKSKMRPYGVGSPNYPEEENNSVTGEGTGFILVANAAIMEENYPEGPDLLRTYDYFLEPGFEYNVVP